MSLQCQRHVDKYSHEKWHDGTRNAGLEIRLFEFAPIVGEKEAELFPPAREVGNLEDTANQAKDQGDEVEVMYQLAPLRVSSQKQSNQEHYETGANLSTIVSGNTNGVVEPIVNVRY